MTANADKVVLEWYGKKTSPTKPEVVTHIMYFIVFRRHDWASTTSNMQRKFGKIRKCSFWDVRADRHTDTVTPWSQYFAPVLGAKYHGCSAARTRGDGVPHFFRHGDASPTPLFWTEMHSVITLMLAVGECRLTYSLWWTAPMLFRQAQPSVNAALATWTSLLVTHGACFSCLTYRLCHSLNCTVLHWSPGTRPRMQKRGCENIDLLQTLKHE